MISVRCKRCGKEVDFLEKENNREFKEVLVERQCVECYGSDGDYDDPPEQKLSNKILDEE